MEIEDISELKNKKINKINLSISTCMRIIDYVAKELIESYDSDVFDSKDDFSTLFLILVSGIIVLPFEGKGNIEKRLEFAENIFNKVRDMLSINENDEKFDNILNELWPNGIKI